MRNVIGMRNIKTGIAVLLCIVISRLLRLESSFYAAVAAVISMENSITDSFRTGKNRMIGTFVGALAGLAFASIEPNNMLLIGAGITVVICVCNLFKLNKSVSIACVVFIGIMINMNGKSPLIYSANRLLDTLMGIIIALLVNYFVFPYTSVNSILKRYHMVSDKVSSMIKGIVSGSGNMDLNSLKCDIDDLKKQIDMYTLEFKFAKGCSRDVRRIKNNTGIYGDICSLLSTVSRLGPGHCLNDTNSERLRGLGYNDINSGQCAGDDFGIVYNYLMAEVIDSLQRLDEI